MRATDAVIRQPEAARPMRRRLFGTITFLAWSAYLYLWLPLITLIAWLLGLRTAFTEWMVHRDQLALRGLVLAGMTSMALAGALVLWAEYNRRRFTGVERRHRAPDVTAPDVASALGADRVAIAALQSGRVLRVHCRPDGSPERVDVVRRLERPAAPSVALVEAVVPAQRPEPAAVPAAADAGA